MISLIKSTFYNERVTKEKLSTFIKKSIKLSFGKECEKFERNFSNWQNRKHSVMLNSGSSANLAIIQAMLNLGKIKKGDRIGFSAVTWSTNVMPLVQLGLIPVPVDVSLKTLNISPFELEKVIKKEKISLLFITNLLGFCDDIEKISTLCAAHNVMLIEDNCESLGSIYKGKKLGNYGFASTFSFYVGHHLSTIEGGMITTDNDELATMVQLVRAHGWDRNLSFSKKSQLRKQFNINSTFYSRYTFYDLGYNLRPTEINGYLGNIQLKYAHEIIEKREKNFLYLADKIYNNSNYFPLEWKHLDVVSNFAVPIICKTEKIRNELVRKCKGKIEIRPVVGGNIVLQPFFRKYSRKSVPFVPNASMIHKNGLYFGNNPELTKKEMSTLLSVFA